MFKILGPKALIILLVVALLTGGMGYGLYEYLMPMRVEKDQELAGIKASIEARRMEVAQLKEEYVLLKAQLEEFTQLGLRGFFNNQNRVEAQNSFEKLRQLAGLLNTRYSISSGELVEDPRATAANYVLLKSPVLLNIESLDDVDVYTFVKALQERFPGNVDITTIELSRQRSITAPLLRQIGSGEPVQMVSARISFDWRTMAPKDKLDEFNTSMSEGKQGRDASTPADGAVVKPVIVDPALVPVPTPAPVSPAPQAVQ